MLILSSPIPCFSALAPAATSAPASLTFVSFTPCLAATLASILCSSTTLTASWALTCLMGPMTLAATYLAGMQVRTGLHTVPASAFVVVITQQLTSLGVDRSGRNSAVIHTGLIGK